MIIHDADDDDDDNDDTQRRDKRLREEFLRLPAPPGIGYKSSRILGLEESYLQVAECHDVWWFVVGTPGIIIIAYKDYSLSSPGSLTEVRTLVACKTLMEMIRLLVSRKMTSIDKWTDDSKDYEEDK